MRLKEFIDIRIVIELKTAKTVAKHALKWKTFVNFWMVAEQTNHPYVAVTVGQSESGKCWCLMVQLCPIPTCCDMPGYVGPIGPIV